MKVLRISFVVCFGFYLCSQTLWADQDESSDPRSPQTKSDSSSVQISPLKSKAIWAIGGSWYVWAMANGALTLADLGGPYTPLQHKIAFVRTAALLIGPAALQIWAQRTTALPAGATPQSFLHRHPQLHRILRDKPEVLLLVSTALITGASGACTLALRALGYY